jgi:phage-related protein
MTIDFAGREATCDICGWGFRFTPDKVEYKDGALYDKSGNLLG